MKFAVPATAKDAVIEKIAKMNRRVRKAGLPVLNYTISEPFVFDDRFFLNVEVDAATVGGNGFKPVGRIDIRQGEENAVFMYDGTKAIDRHFDDEICCDHCGIKRFRKTVYIVRDKDGLELNIGSSCMEVACGIPASELMIADYVRKACQEMEDDFNVAFSAQTAFSTKKVAALAIKLSEEKGYISKAKGEEIGVVPTAQRVRDMMAGYVASPDLTEDDLAKAEFALALAQNVEEKSNFDQNLRILAKSERIEAKYIGFIAYSAVLFIKETTQKADTSNSEFVGKPKERIKGVKATLSNVYKGVSFMGNFYILTFIDATGNVLSWMTNTLTPVLLPGQTYEIDFTVKEHEVYKNTRQTKVLRVKAKGI